jgi:Tol biopolymer transport system component
MDSLEPGRQSSPAEPAAHPKKWILGWTGLGLIILIGLGCSVYLAYGYIRNSIRSIPLTSSFLSDETPLNQIAFAGNDGNIWLVSPTGEDLRSVTTDQRGYRFPTWAPDSRHLAFVGPDPVEGINALYIMAIGELKPKVVFKEPKSMPFYLYWAPNSTHLTFLTQEISGLTMRLVDLNQPGFTRTIGEGAPFYWVWSPNDHYLLMHVGGSAAFSEEAHLSLIETRQGAERQQLEWAPGQFQAPVWSRDGHNFFYIALDEDGQEAIYKSHVETLQSQRVTDLSGFALMALSPNDQYMAYLQFEPGAQVPFGKAYLVDTAGQEPTPLADFLVASIYWSPDGNKLALLGLTRGPEGPTAKIGGLAAPLAQEAQLRWWIYDVEAETLEPLVSFTPTTAFLQTVPFFDQYHLSLTFWSPDSRYFVVTKKNKEDEHGSVWVYDTTGQKEAHRVGDGDFAVWSWR